MLFTSIKICNLPPNPLVTRFPNIYVAFARGLLIHRRRRFFMPSLGETPCWLTYDRLLLDCWLTWTSLDCLGWFENKNDVKDLGCISVRDSCCFPEASERCWGTQFASLGMGGFPKSGDGGEKTCGRSWIFRCIYIYEYMNIWIYEYMYGNQIPPMNLCRKSRALNSPGKKRGRFYLVKFLTQETRNPD